ncbi:MAG: agmatine deiminase family protein [Bacteroidetes bacterium]|jgi:agmatine deiminase|nr:agmatine deiminase family protein [Bacteroidota bacterium]
MKALDGYPAERGYYFPAEWKKHRATWLTYPHNPESWEPKELCKARDEYLEFMAVISRGEEIRILVQDEMTKHELRDKLDGKDVDVSRVEIFIQPGNDCWSRDHAPVFLKHKQTGEIAACGFAFNGWGSKYDHDLDNLLKWYIIEQEECPYFKSDMVLEGGSIETNGAGLLLTTTACLLNRNRNPGMDRATIENQLKNYFDVNTIIWLSEGIAGDDTDGHIDDIARFIDVNNVITVLEDNKSDKNYQPLRNNYDHLEKMAKEGYFRDIFALPLPEAVFTKNDRLPASYANFYVCNAGVIVPVFKCRQDAKALKQIQDCFPDKKIFPVDSREIIKGLGSWHCLSQQVPA